MKPRLSCVALLSLVLASCGGTPDPGVVIPPDRPWAWVDGAWTQPVPPWGSPVRLGLPVPLESILLGERGGLGAYGAHEGAHAEGLNHVWIPIVRGTQVNSWAAGVVTRIEDLGDRGTGDGLHEYFVTVDYGDGLIGKHLDVDTPLVAEGDHVEEGGPIAVARSAEFMLADMRRTDGERYGSGATVSPFDYLRDDLKAALVARHVAEVVEPYFAHGMSAGASRPWEPRLTNPMLFHEDGSVAGEWVLSNKGWRMPDPSYFDVLMILDVTNDYGTFKRFEAVDNDSSLPGTKPGTAGEWVASDGPGKLRFVAPEGTRYALYTVDESSGRATLTIEWQLGSYPTEITANAAVYVERSPLCVRCDAMELGLL